jgi:hypothetical protein
MLGVWSTKVDPIGEGVHHRHPLTGGTLTLKMVCHASMRIHPLYTPEGEPLPEGSH